LLALLRERAGQELKLSDLREEVDSVSVYQMLRRLSVKGLVSGQWRIEFPRRGFVVYRPGF
jgi:DNA-binding PadR family transcriptional regulator